MHVVAARGLAIGPGIGQRMAAFARAYAEGSIAVHTAGERMAVRMASGVVEGNMMVRRTATEPYFVVGRASVRTDSSLESPDGAHMEDSALGMALELVGPASAAGIVDSDVAVQAANVPTAGRTLSQMSRSAGNRGRRSMIGASPSDEDRGARARSLPRSRRFPWVI
jgi:hypothetical protein